MFYIVTAEITKTEYMAENDEKFIVSMAVDTEFQAEAYDLFNRYWAAKCSPYSVSYYVSIISVQPMITKAMIEEMES